MAVISQGQQSTGLTIATTPYSANDQVGPLFTFTNVAAAAGGAVNIESITLEDHGDITIIYDVIFFRQTVALAGDNAQFAISDADARFASPAFPISMADIGNNRVGGVTPFFTFDCAGTSLFAALITRTAHPVFVTVNDLFLTIRARQY